MNEKIVSAALDFSGPYCSIAVKKNNEIVLEQTKEMRRREAAELAIWIECVLHEANLSINSITEWTVGSGPGSFTGMRIAAALVCGWSFEKAEVRSRTVPSAFAIAADLNLQSGDNCAVIFDGRNHEIILFGVTKNGNDLIADGRNAILNQSQAADYFKLNHFDRFGALSYEAESIKKILPENFSLEIFDHINVKQLFTDNKLPFNNDLTKLFYIRPSTVTK